MFGDKRKSCSRQYEAVCLADGGAEHVIQFIVDGDDMMSAGKGMFQKIGWNGDNFGDGATSGDAFFASLFALSGEGVYAPLSFSQSLVPCGFRGRLS